MLNSDWDAELQTALLGTGWSKWSSGVAQESSICFAHLQRGSETRTITLSRDRFATPKARLDEIRRQLEGGQDLRRLAVEIADVDGRDTL